MDISLLKKKFQEYADRMAVIRRLSSPKLEETDNAENYSQRLRKNFELIGKLAEENRNMLSNDLFPFLEAQEELDGSLTKELRDLGDTLLNMGGTEDFENLDLPITSLISERLLKDAKDKRDLTEYIKQLDREFIVCYSLMNITQRVSAKPEISKFYREKGLDVGSEFLALLNKDHFLDIEDMECRHIVLTNSRFISAFYEMIWGNQKMNQRDLDLLEQMLDISEDAFYHEAVLDFDWKYFRFRTLEYFFQMTEMNNARGLTRKQLLQISSHIADMEHLLESDREYFSKLLGNSFIPSIMERIRYLVGITPLEEYRDNLLSFYISRDKMDFSPDGFYSNILTPLELLFMVDGDNITTEECFLVRDIYRNICAYLFHMPNTSSMSFSMEWVSIIIQHFIDLPGGVHFEDFILQCMAALHPPTYIHSKMVAQLTECLTRHLIKMKPELFLGIMGCDSIFDVAGKKDSIIAYAYHAAVCHDFGKINIIDTIFVYGRKLLDFEFNIIKSHPTIGARFLAAHESTKEYADVAAGHHRWYDDSRGYPEDFKTWDSPYKTIIDIVQCADCMDAATDTVGRSYNRGKTLYDFLEELRADSGKRYAPWLLEVFDRPEVRRDVEFLLTKGRDKNYLDTYSLLKNVQEEEV